MAQGPRSVFSFHLIHGHAHWCLISLLPCSLPLPAQLHLPSLPASRHDGQGLHELPPVPLRQREHCQPGQLHARHKKGEKPAWIGKWEIAISGKQLDNVLGDFCIFRHDLAFGNRRNQRQSSSPVTKAKAPKVQATEGKVPLERETGFRDEISLGESVRTRHIIIDTLPCVSITSRNQDAHMAKNADSDTLTLMAEEKVCGKGSVALLKESIQLGCVSHDSHPTKSFLRKEDKWGPKHTVKFSCR